MSNSVQGNPITNPDEFKSGEHFISYPLYTITPVKMSILENAGGYCVEDKDGNIFIVGFMSALNAGWDKLNLPESAAYKQHIENKIKKYGKR
jgi:hypothetical protein